MRAHLSFVCLALFAVAASAQDAKSLVDAGQAKLDKDDWKGSIEDFTRALDLDPANPLAYKGRAFGRQMLLDYDGAIADLDKAVELDPSFKMAWNNRANAKRCKGDYQGSIADADHALALDPKFDFALLNRAYGKFLLEDLDGAAADFQTAFDVETKARDYPNLWLWAIRARGGKQAEGDAALRAHVKGLEKPDAWYAHVSSFLLGDEKEEALLRAAEEGTDAQKAEHRCEASYYAGLRRHLGGDMEGAAALFKKCIDTGKSDYVEYHAATVALAALSKPGK